MKDFLFNPHTCLMTWSDSSTVAGGLAVKPSVASTGSWNKMSLLL